MNEKGFSVPAFISTIIIILVFVFMFPVIQASLDQATINFVNFAYGTLLTTMLYGAVLVMGILVLIHPFQEDQIEKVRRTGF